MSKLSLLVNRLIPQSLERKLRTFRDKNLRKYTEEPLPPAIFSQERHYKISFCTTCMNRLFHLRETIEQNMRDNSNYPNVEFVLIDYNSQDGLEAYAKKHLTPYIEKGILNYYKTKQPQKFHASKAKNLSHALALGEIVCNVDGDNFTGKDFAYYINYLLLQRKNRAIYQFHKAPYWGTVGRLCFYKDDFMQLGGYDEHLLAIGHEDLDLVNRGRAWGLELVQNQVENFQRYLSNTTLEKAVNCTDTNENFYDLNQANIQQSDENIRQGKLRANPDGMENFVVYKNFQPEPLQSRDLIAKLSPQPAKLV